MLAVSTVATSARLGLATETPGAAGAPAPAAVVVGVAQRDQDRAALAGLVASLRRASGIPCP